MSVSSLVARHRSHRSRLFLARIRDAVPSPSLSPSPSPCPEYCRTLPLQRRPLLAFLPTPSLLPFQHFYRGGFPVLLSGSLFHLPFVALRGIHQTIPLEAKPQPQRTDKPPLVFKKKKKKPPRAAPADAPYIPDSVRTADKKVPETIEIAEGMTVKQLAGEVKQGLPSVQDMLSNLGESAVSPTDVVNIDAAELVALEFGYLVKRVQSARLSGGHGLSLNAGRNIKPRSAVITVMGHVDHGKTSLLDALRQTSVAAKEAGGITQHVGAFVVPMPSGGSLTFLDTPGHAAFSEMRARGAAVTDAVVLVVAADDGVMPQTLEALAHAQNANVPIVVAINKCDKPDANPNRVREQLGGHGVELEDIGGDVQVVEISATKSLGLEKLEEALLLQAEMMDLRAPVDGDVHAVVIEARLDRGHGPTATVIVRSGTLVPGLYVVIGTEWGRVRSMRDTWGQLASCAGPSVPVEIEGLRGLPMAGDELIVVSNEERARKLSHGRKLRAEEERLARLSLKAAMALAEEREAEEEEKMLLEEAQKQEELEEHGSDNDDDDGNDDDNDNDEYAEDNSGDINNRKEKKPKVERNLKSERSPVRAVKKIKVELPLVVKADVQGTVQAVTQALESLNSSQVKISILHSSVGSVSQSDLDLAEACGACIVGFNIRKMSAAIEAAARRANIDVRQHRIIYHLLEDIGNLIVSKAPGVEESQVAGQAEVLQVFEIKGKGREHKGAAVIAGCRVFEGRMARGGRVRVLRSGELVFEGEFHSLKREKLDVDAVAKGNECGLIVERWNDYRVGDIVQCVELVRRKPKFVSHESGAVRIEC